MKSLKEVKEEIEKYLNEVDCYSAEPFAKIAFDKYYPEITQIVPLVNLSISYLGMYSIVFNPEIIDQMKEKYPEALI